METGEVALFMTDFLHPHLDKKDIERISSLGLAHIGDGVYEIMTRAWLVCQGMQTARGLHSKTVALVRAGAQYRAAQLILPHLSAEESEVFRHGRNAKPKTIPKAASHAEYAYATALETLFGWLYLQGEYDRLNQLYEIISQDFDEMLGKKPKP